MQWWKHHGIFCPFIHEKNSESMQLRHCKGVQTHWMNECEIFIYLPKKIVLVDLHSISTFAYDGYLHCMFVDRSLLLKARASFIFFVKSQNRMQCWTNFQAFQTKILFNIDSVLKDEMEQWATRRYFDIIDRCYVKVSY